MYYEKIYYDKFDIDIIWYLSPEDFLFRWLHHKHVIYAVLGVILMMAAFFYGIQVGRRLVERFSLSENFLISVLLSVFAGVSFWFIDSYELNFGQVFDRKLRWVIFSAILHMCVVTSAAVIIGVCVDEILKSIKKYVQRDTRCSNFLDTAPALLGFTKERRRDVCWGIIYLLAVLYVIKVLGGQLAIIADLEKKQVLKEKAKNKYELFIKSDSGWAIPSFTLRLVGATNNYKFFCRQILSKNSVPDTLWQPVVMPSAHIAYMEKKDYIKTKQK